VALTVPLCFVSLGTDWNHGVALLSALLKSNGFATRLVILKNWWDFSKVVDETDAPWMCFSAVTQTDYDALVPYMRLASIEGKDVLLGGTWAGLGRPVDWSVTQVCRGEGETLPDYLQAGDDRLFQARMVYPDLNALPPPDYDLFKAVPFDRGLPQTAGKMCLPYVSSRGCPFPCAFCQVRKQPAFRVRTKVEEDLLELRERYQPDLFFIGDANLPYDMPKWRESWGEFRHPFVAYIRADIQPERLEWLIDRGMVGCAFGVESGDEFFRNTVLRKQLDDAELWRTVAALNTANVWFMPYFMSGVPGETFAQQTKTAQLARKLGPLSIVWKYEEL
jgi:radical SAM superfamily enzyme YgiQ (UPF0313 family)